MSVPYVLTDTSASIFLDFVPFTVPMTHPNWDAIVEALNNVDTTEDDLRPLLDVASTVANYLMGEGVEYRDRALYFDGQAIDNGLTRRILQHMDAGQEGLAAPLVEFLKKVLENPSRRAVQGLYDWVAASGLPITPEGDVLAYKIVNHDFTDCYTNKFDNSPGKRVEVRRNEVDEDPDRTCSYGLHVCSAKYLPEYGPSDRAVVIVKIHPKDFVAVPRDYNTAKARVAGYDVLTQVPTETAATFFPNAHVFDWSQWKPDFEVGQVWLNRGGEEVTITIIDDDNNSGSETIWGITDEGSFSYFSDGSYWSDAESDNDLVEFVR